MEVLRKRVRMVVYALTITVFCVSLLIQYLAFTGVIPIYTDSFWFDVFSYAVLLLCFSHLRLVYILGKQRRQKHPLHILYDVLLTLVSGVLISLIDITLVFYYLPGVPAALLLGYAWNPVFSDKRRDLRTLYAIAIYVFLFITHVFVYFGFLLGLL